MITVKDNHHSSHLIHDNAIHEYIFKNASRAAADEVLDYVKDTLENAAPNQEVLQLITFNDTLPPIRSLLEPGRKPIKGTTRRGRVAFLYHESSARILLATVVQAMRLIGVEARYFPHREREDAIVWLTQGSASRLR